MKKVIFLDIDGVLNTEQTDIRLIEKYGESKYEKYLYDDYGRIFDDNAVKALRKIIDKTNAQIVISSTWRVRGLTFLNSLWKKRNMPGKIIGITPSLRLESRGEEIAEWMRRNPVDKYVIIDDNKDILLEQGLNFVKTRWEMGLTESLADQCIEILNK